MTKVESQVLLDAVGVRSVLLELRSAEQGESKGRGKISGTILKKIR
jgi:hypothetical protein